MNNKKMELEIETLISDLNIDPPNTWEGPFMKKLTDETIVLQHELAINLKKLMEYFNELSAEEQARVIEYKKLLSYK